MSDEVRAFLGSAPPLTEENIEEINACFRPFLFMRRKTCEVAATCCRRLEKLPPEHPIWQEQHMTEPRHYWTIKPEQLTPCPFCGRLGTVKEYRARMIWLFGLLAAITAGKIADRILRPWANWVWWIPMLLTVAFVLVLSSVFADLSDGLAARDPANRENDEME